MRNQTLFFGERWDAPVVDDARQVPAPIGQQCYQCCEAVVEGDRGFLRVAFRMGPDGGLVGSEEPVHAECDLRGVMGHQVGVCHCTGHGADRAAARLVWQKVGEQRGRPLEEFPPAPAKVPCPEGFHWIGQSFRTCEKCGLPAWEHDGNAVARDRSTPFSDLPDADFWVLSPWKPGQREAFRRKWDPDYRPEPKPRIRACVEAWPEAEDGAYNPKCCRFPKSCSATSYDPEQVTDEYLEPRSTNAHLSDGPS